MFAVAGYHFCFESHFYEYGGSEFHHVVGFPAIVLPGENPHYIGYKRLCENTFTSFAPGKYTRGNSTTCIYTVYIRFLKKQPDT